MMSNGYYRPIVDATRTFVLLVTITLIGLSVTVARGDNWTRSLLHGYVPDPLVKPPLYFVTISSIGEHLVGSCALHETTKAAAITIAGSADASGDFYPSAYLQLGDTLDGKWSTVGRTRSKGRHLVRRIKPGGSDIDLHVDLDKFRAYIGKAKYGRAVLESGHSAVFLIDCLLPPEDAPRSTKFRWK
ncbi:hypothetical protein BH18VER1_BH18VER1_17220 [soil metagenome]